jgi:hypothetical protein
VHLILALVLLGSGISMMSGIGFVDHRVRDDFLTNVYALVADIHIWAGYQLAHFTLRLAAQRSGSASMAF